MSKTMPQETTANKFERVSLLRSGSWTPIPKFFFRLRRYYPDLPDSWWTTLFYILDVTLGSPSGTEGTLAYSEVPVQSFSFKNWVAALEGHGRLLTREVAGYTDIKGSTFILNSDATEANWLDFHDLLRVAFREGLLSREHSVEEVRERFAQFRDIKSPPPPFWSTLLLRCMVAPGKDEENFKEYEASEWHKEFGELDVWDNRNWIKRGFDTLELHRWFDRSAEESGGEVYWYLTKLFHEAWVCSSEDDSRPFLPDDVEQLNKVVSFGNAEEDAARDLRPVLDKYFKKVEIDGETWLESEWLTKQWQWAKNQRQIDAVLATTPNPFHGIINVLEDKRKRILSRPK